METSASALAGQERIQRLWDTEFEDHNPFRRPLIISGSDKEARDVLLEDLMARARRRGWLVACVELAHATTFGDAHADAADRLLAQVPRRALRTRRRLKRAIEKLRREQRRWGDSSTGSIRLLVSIADIIEAHHAGIVYAYGDLDDASDIHLRRMWTLVGIARREVLLIVGSPQLPIRMTDLQQSFERSLFESLDRG